MRPGWADVTPQNGTFGADEAPADINVFMVLDATSGSEVVGADDAVVGEDNAARCHAQICSMIGDRTAHTAHQAAYGQTTNAVSAPSVIKVTRILQII